MSLQPTERRIAFTASDGTPLSAVLDEGPRKPAGAVLLLPGFYRHAESRRIRELSRELSRRWLTLTLDFRGHGQSKGRFTFGRLEHLDVAAALNEIARCGVERVVLVGFSMGGAAAITSAASARENDLDIRGAVAISAPARFGLIRPRPWRGGRRYVAWEDAWPPPRMEWSFPFTDKQVPEDLVTQLGDLPVRQIHARRDWLVDDAIGRKLHRVRPASEFFLLDVPGAMHADELMGAQRSILLRLVRPFVDARLDISHASTGPTSAVAAPFEAGLADELRHREAWSADLGGAGPVGTPSGVIAVPAGRDGVHLAFASGGETCWARGLRDGSVRGINLLRNALATDGLAWSAAERAGLLAARAQIEGVTERRHATAHVVRLRGEGGFTIEDMDDDT